MEVKTSLLRLLVIVGLAFLTESSEIGGSGNDDNHSTRKEIINGQEAIQEKSHQKTARLKEQIVKLKEQNDKLKQRIVQFEQNRNDELQQDKQLQELRRENEVLRLADSEINKSIRQKDSSELTVKYCRNTNNAERTLEKLAKKEEETKELSKEINNCKILVEQSRTRLVKGENERISRLEVKINGTWGTVCTDYDKFEFSTRRIWNMASVVCRSLGFSKGNYIKVHRYLPRGFFRYATKEVPIHMDYVVNCKGNEKSIHDCPEDHRNTKYRGSCTRSLARKGRHTADVFINCK